MNNDLLTLPQDADPQLRRAAIFVSTGDFANADAYCERVLDTAPENAAAYLLKAMAKCKAQKAEQLATVPGLPEMAEFKLARQFADAEFAAKLDELVREYEAGKGAEMSLAALGEACALRQEVLRNLLQDEPSDDLDAEGGPVAVERKPAVQGKGLPDELAAEVRKRIEAEQALMHAPTPLAAEREADATAALKDKIAPIFREKLAALLPQLEKIIENPNIPKSDREKASKRHDKIRALLKDPGADLRTLSYESERCQVEFGNLSGYLNHSDIGLWIAIGVLILFAIFAFAFLV